MDVSAKLRRIPIDEGAHALILCGRVKFSKCVAAAARADAAFETSGKAIRILVLDLRVFRSARISIWFISAGTVDAFFKICHAPCRSLKPANDLQGYAAWEIHPTMKIEAIRN